MTAPQVFLTPTDRRLINRLQRGLPIVPQPYAAVAAELGLTETDLLARIQRLLDTGILSRFGPMFQIERAGGRFTLAAIAVPPERFEEVAALVNAFPEVAHNYQRTHALNLWFVVAAESRARVDAVLTEVQARTGLPVYDMPKQREFHVCLRFEA